MILKRGGAKTGFLDIGFRKTALIGPNDPKFCMQLVVAIIVSYISDISWLIE